MVEGKVKSTNNGSSTMDNSNTELLRAQEQLKQVISTLVDMGIMIHDFEGTLESKEGLMERM